MKNNQGKQKGSPKSRKKLEYPKKPALPLSRKAIYLDVKDNRQRKRLEGDLKRLGASIEEFLSKDINYVITSEPRPKEKKSVENGPDSPAGVSNPSPFNCGPSPSPSTVENKPAATVPRGKALAEKGRLRASISTVVQNAERLQIKIVNVEAAYKWIDKELQKLPKVAQKETKGAGKQKTGPLGRKSKSLKGPFLKFETVAQTYRPVYSQIEIWPRVNIDTPYGSCPYDGTIIAGGDRSREERGELVARAQLDVFTPETPQDKKDDKPSIATPSANTQSKDKNTESDNEVLGGAKLVTAGELRRRREKLKRQERKRGYCECCQLKYEDLDKHVRDDQHKAYVREKSNFSELDALIESGPSTANFLKSVLMHHCYNTRPHPVESSSAEESEGSDNTKAKKAEKPKLPSPKLTAKSHVSNSPRKVASKVNQRGTTLSWSCKSPSSKRKVHKNGSEKQDQSGGPSATVNKPDEQSLKDNQTEKKSHVTCVWSTRKSVAQKDNHEVVKSGNQTVEAQNIRVTSSKLKTKSPLVAKESSKSVESARQFKKNMPLDKLDSSVEKVEEVGSSPKPLLKQSAGQTTEQDNHNRSPRCLRKRDKAADGEDIEKFVQNDEQDITCEAKLDQRVTRASHDNKSATSTVYVGKKGSGDAENKQEHDGDTEVANYKSDLANENISPAKHEKRNLRKCQEPQVDKFQRQECDVDTKRTLRNSGQQQIKHTEQISEEGNRRILRNSKAVDSPEKNIDKKGERINTVKNTAAETALDQSEHASSVPAVQHRDHSPRTRSNKSLLNDSKSLLLPNPNVKNSAENSKVTNNLDSKGNPMKGERMKSSCSEERKWKNTVKDTGQQNLLSKDVDLPFSAEELQAAMMAELIFTKTIAEKVKERQVLRKENSSRNTSPGSVRSEVCSVVCSSPSRGRSQTPVSLRTARVMGSEGAGRDNSPLVITPKKGSAVENPGRKSRSRWKTPNEMQGVESTSMNRRPRKGLIKRLQPDHVVASNILDEKSTESEGRRLSGTETPLENSAKIVEMRPRKSRYVIRCTSPVKWSTGSAPSSPISSEDEYKGLPDKGQGRQLRSRERDGKSATLNQNPEVMSEQTKLGNVPGVTLPSQRKKTVGQNIVDECSGGSKNTLLRSPNRNCAASSNAAIVCGQSRKRKIDVVDLTEDSSASLTVGNVRNFGSGVSVQSDLVTDSNTRSLENRSQTAVVEDDGETHNSSRSLRNQSHTAVVEGDGETHNSSRSLRNQSQTAVVEEDGETHNSSRSLRNRSQTAVVEEDGETYNTSRSLRNRSQTGVEEAGSHSPIFKKSPSVKRRRIERLQKETDSKRDDEGIVINGVANNIAGKESSKEAKVLPTEQTVSSPSRNTCRTRSAGRTTQADLKPSAPVRSATDDVQTCRSQSPSKLSITNNILNFPSRSRTRSAGGTTADPEPSPPLKSETKSFLASSSQSPSKLPTRDKMLNSPSRSRTRSAGRITSADPKPSTPVKSATDSALASRSPNKNGARSAVGTIPLDVRTSTPVKSASNDVQILSSPKSGYSRTPRSSRRKKWKTKSSPRDPDADSPQISDSDNSSTGTKRRKLEKLKFKVDDVDKIIAENSLQNKCKSSSLIEGNKISLGCPDKRSARPSLHLRNEETDVSSSLKDLQASGLCVSVPEVKDVSPRKMSKCNHSMVINKNADEICLNKTADKNSLSVVSENLNESENSKKNTSTKTVKLNSSWSLLSNRSVSKLLNSEDDKVSFAGFTEEEMDVCKSLPSDLSFEERSEVEMEDTSEHEWVVEEGKEGKAEQDPVDDKTAEVDGEDDEEEDMYQQYLPHSFSSPGRRSDSSWGDACEMYLDKSIKRGNSSLLGFIRSPSRNRDRTDSEGTFSPHSEVMIETPQKKRRSRRDIGVSLFDVEKVDDEIEFNYKSPQKFRKQFSPLRFENGVVITENEKKKRTSTPSRKALHDKFDMEQITSPFGVESSKRENSERRTKAEKKFFKGGSTNKKSFKMEFAQEFENKKNCKQKHRPDCDSSSNVLKPKSRVKKR